MSTPKEFFVPAELARRLSEERIRSAEIESKMAAIEEQAKQAYKAGMANSARGLLDMNSVYGNAATYPSAERKQPMPPTVEEEGAWDAPISALVDMWQVRFGNGWVKVDFTDAFIQVATSRLQRVGRLEQRNRTYDGTMYKLVS